MTKETARQIIKALVDKYDRIRQENKLSKYNEENTKTEFIEPLFEALGWDVRNTYHPDEVTLAEAVVAKCFVADEKPARLIVDRAYDSDQLDHRLAVEHGIELIAPHRYNRQASSTQDGRVLRRYKRRWKVERLFAWLQNFRRIQVRYDYYAQNFLGFVQLGCMMILLRRCL